MFRSLFASGRLLDSKLFNFSVSRCFVSRMNNSSLASGKVLLSQREGVLTFTFNNERVKNATDYEIYDAISAQMNTSAADDSVKMVVFTGKGDFYSSGININVLSSIFSSPEKEKLIYEGTASIKSFVNAFIDFPKPIIAAVNGPALGLQMTTLALKDYIICSDSAYFQTPFSKIGVTAEGCSSVLFPDVFGFSKANSLLMFSERITAQEALTFGFVSKIISKENFDEEIENIIYGENGILKAYSYNSIMAVKSIVRNEDWKRKMHAVNEAECAALTKLWFGSDFETRINKFLQKKR